MAATGREFFTAKTVAEALAEFRPAHRTATETVALDDAAGRIPAADILAGEALPGFDRSSVDGYAVRAQDTFGASESIPAYLTLTGSVAMGAPADVALPAHSAIAVPTGGALPDGADAVVMIEYTQEAMAGTIEVVRPVAPGEGIVRADEDMAPGQAAVRARRAAESPGRRHAGRAGHRRARGAHPARGEHPGHRRRAHRARTPGPSAPGRCATR